MELIDCMIHSAICKQVDFSEQSGHSTHFSEQSGHSTHFSEQSGHSTHFSEQSGHSTHFQVGGDNPKVEGQAFF